MKEPKTAKLLLKKNTIYPVDVIHYETGLVTLAERSNVFNTVSIKNVEFDFTDFSGRTRNFSESIQKVTFSPHCTVFTNLCC